MSLNPVGSILQGVILGVAVVLPGLSAGTAALIMGIYDQLVEDVSRLNLKPHIFKGIGVVTGILVGARVTGYMMENYLSILSAYLFGVIMASAWFIFRQNLPMRAGGVLAWMAGVLAAIALSSEPLGQVGSQTGLDLGRVFVGGSVASSAMMLPGMSGGSLLIMMGMYDDLLLAVNNFDFPVLLVFLLGAIVGVFLVTKLLARVISLFPVTMYLFLGGMVLGSARAVWVGLAGIPEMVAFFTGVFTVMVSVRR